jgi:alcohol dehydrogenase (cytochrome c)
MVTASDLVFSGDWSGNFNAFDARTGQKLWSAPTQAGITASPITYEVAGRQYVAIETGWGGDVTGTQAALNRLVPGDYPPVPTGGAVYMFAVE